MTKTKISVYGHVPNYYDIKSLKDLCVPFGIQTGPFGSQLHQKDYLPTGTPIITVEHLGENRILHQDLPRISDSDRNRLSRYWMQKGDIIFSRVGSVDRRALVRNEEDGWLFSGRCLRIRPDPSQISPNFLSWFFGLEAFKDYIRRIAVGATMPSLNTTILSNIPIMVPPPPEQRAIADMLDALDDKIELNRRTSVTLEEMAMAVFKAWFSENEDAIAWKVVPLPEMIDVNPTRSLKKGMIAPYLDMANMPTQGHRAIEWINRPFGSGTKFINGDTLLARITPCLENGKTAFADFLEDDQVGWGSTEYIILHPKPPLPAEFGYFLARSEELRNHTIQNMTGTSGRQRAPAACFDKYMLAVPPESLAKRFGEFAKDVMTKIRSNDQQSRTLAALRDTLLPRLMSGEVKVKDWEKEL
jgi:type I restriction enzyme, S subunit